MSGKAENKTEPVSVQPKKNRGKPSIWIKNTGGRTVLVEEGLARILIEQLKAVAVDAPK
jgi:hypothetical protein